MEELEHLWPTEEDALAAGALESREDLREWRKRRWESSHALQFWYKDLESVTIPSIWIPLSWQEGQALYKYHVLSNPFAAEATRAQAKDELEDTSQQPTLRSVLDTLRVHLEESIASFPIQRVFVKLGTRSPKDTPLRRDPKHVKRLLKQELASVEPGNGRKALVAVVRATAMSMCCCSGQEVIDMLCGSMRVADDLRRAHSWGEGIWSKDPPVVVLREWIEEISRSPEREMRGFVYKGKLTALSQYNDFCDAPIDKGNMVDGIVKCLSSVVLPDHLQTCVLDFCSLENKAIIVEINPWGKTTGACLFHWEKDADDLRSEPLTVRWSEREKEEEEEEWLERYLTADWVKMVKAIWKKDVSCRIA